MKEEAVEQPKKIDTLNVDVNADVNLNLDKDVDVDAPNVQTNTVGSVNESQNLKVDMPAVDA